MHLRQFRLHFLFFIKFCRNVVAPPFPTSVSASAPFLLQFRVQVSRDFRLPGFGLSLQLHVCLRRVDAFPFPASFPLFVHVRTGYAEWFDLGCSIPCSSANSGSISVFVSAVSILHVWRCKTVAHSASFPCSHRLPAAFPCFWLQPHVLHFRPYFRVRWSARDDYFRLHV